MRVWRRLSAAVLGMSVLWAASAGGQALAPAVGQEQQGIAQIVKHHSFEELRSMGLVLQAPAVPEAIDPLAIYSNIATGSGEGFGQGPSENQAGNQITRVVMDDLTFTTLSGVGTINKLKFTVANLNIGVTVTARPRLRFWRANGPPVGPGLPGAPGTYYNDGVVDVGITYNAVAFPPGISTLNAPVSVPFAVPAGTTTTLWVGMTFDDNNGATGATLGQLNFLGQGTFGPIELGSSANVVFETTAAGSFFQASNPAGAPVFFSSSTANMGWELMVTTLPVELEGFEIE